MMLRRASSGKKTGQRPTDHQRHEPINVEVGRLHCRYASAILQDGHRVAKAKYLLEAMADVEQRLAPVAQGLEQGLQPVDLGPAQGCGRLVEDKNRGVDRNAFRNLDELL